MSALRKLASKLVLLTALASAQPALAADACPAFRWTTLGTAGGPVPTLDRSEPANLLDVGSQSILVDTGDGTVTQLARSGRDLRNVHSVFLSHLHWDHVGGLSAVIGLRWMNTFPGDLTIYGPPGTQTMVDGIVASLGPSARIGFGTGAKSADPASNLLVVELKDGDTINLPEGVAVRVATNSHYDAGLESGTLSLSYRFDQGRRSLTYSGDTGPSQKLTDLARNSDMLVSEVIALDPLVKEIVSHRPDMSAATREQMRQHLSTHHVDAADVGRMAATAGVRRVVLTHFAVPGPLRASEGYVRSGVRRHFTGPLNLASDLASFEIGCKSTTSAQEN